MTDVRLKISPPWVIYVHELTALFDADPHIAFSINYNKPSVTIAIAKGDGVKAAAIAKLLPPVKYFGNVALIINVECASMPNIAFTSAKELFEAAFKGNPNFVECIVPGSEYWYVPFTYVVFKKDVVQFFGDNMRDPRGLISTLYQEIASDVFEDVDGYFAGGGVCFCTDVDHMSLGAPLGEWP